MAGWGKDYDIEIPKEPRHGRRASLPLYQTSLGSMYSGHSEKVLASVPLKYLKGQAQLIFTSPPFPLNTKKRYGNKQGKEYIEWFASFAPLFKRALRPDGSIVIEIGNAWEPGQPTMSTTVLKALLAFLEKGKLHLCQEFVWYNPARYPSPTEWVNKERIRVKDSFTRFWWMSQSERPKADNSKVLKEYSPSMKRLIKTGKYNAGMRPSGHTANPTSFLTDNGGAIPPNVFGMDDIPSIDQTITPKVFEKATNVLKAANTGSTDAYREFCIAKNSTIHPARMPRPLVEFFVKFLTDENDLVIDPFGGSNTTGAVAEEMGRRWVSIEAQWEYAAHSIGRFAPETIEETCTDLKVTKRAEPEQLDGLIGLPIVAGTANASSS